jgi:hypothetical protein
VAGENLLAELARRPFAPLQPSLHGGVALLERRAWVLLGRAFLQGTGKGNHASRVVADLLFMEACCGDVPAMISAQRRIKQYHRHPTQLVAIGVRKESFARRLSWLGRELHFVDTQINRQ